MRELLEALPTLSLERASHLHLLDTCFVIDMAQRRSLHKALGTPVAMTSFNIEELARVAHHCGPGVKEDIRHFLRSHPNFLVVPVPVHPGDREAERSFVESADSSLLLKVVDPSDAVLMAAAILTHSDVFTKDKHHLFTVVLENYLTAYGIHVWKEWRDIQNISF
jgi:hypothetical protein